MPYTTLISAAQLQGLLAGVAPPVLLDCGFDLADTEAGQRAWAAGHLPGAHHAHLDRDLSGAKTGRNGRHPLPTRERLAPTAAAWGIRPGVQVICYDDHGGVYAARAWWLLRWLGHADVAVLDGGRGAWARLPAPLSTKPQPPAGAQSHAASYPASEPAMPTVEAPQLQQRLGACLLVDARAPERYRGDVEPLDPVAGHIPGAINRFFKDNLAADGCFKPAIQLRQEWGDLVAQQGGLGVVHQCGSGVTACHNLLAMTHAGLDAGALYPGSWSEWCSDPARPVARG